MIYTLIAQNSVGLPKGALCEITEVSRSGLYRFLSSVKEKVDSIEAKLIEHIEHICVDMPGYGYRRVTKALQRMGYRINHKRVLRLMRRTTCYVSVKGVLYERLIPGTILLSIPTWLKK